MSLFPRVQLAIAGLLVTGLWMAGASLGRAQRNPEARAEYLSTRNLDDEAEALEAYLLKGLRERALGTVRQRKRTADFFSFVLAVSGATLDTMKRLEEKGIDVIHAITARSRPLMEQALLADLVVVGTVVGVEQNGSVPDGHRHTLRVVVRDSLKGTVPADTILIRQKRRVSRRSPDPKPEVGETFLFLASNGLYRYYLARNTDPDARPSESELRRRYSLYRRYRIKKGRLLWEGRTREETRRALRSVRTLAGWIQSP
ncbi:MAG: hypothetical protein ABEK84_02910 [Salinibacter sp.]